MITSRIARLQIEGSRQGQLSSSWLRMSAVEASFRASQVQVTELTKVVQQAGREQNKKNGVTRTSCVEMKLFHEGGRS